ncbi:MAG: hypothetical protein CMM85_10455 [Rhodothermaceae bacterium]|nr:hypothetical protein [Rhodothermaceae bacterium]
MDLDDLSEAIGIELETDEYDFETLGGLILHLAGDIPSPGDEVEHEGLLFRVEGVEDNRILGVRVERLPEPETPEA